MLLYGMRQGSPWELLRWMLKEEYGFEALPEIQREAKGKPFFPNLPRLHFSLSDSGDYALCALSAAPVGVDIERIRPRRENLPRFALSEKEYARFCGEGGDWSLFYTLWTRREAWCKYTGRGLGDSWGQDTPTGLFFASYGGETWRAAVCGEEPPPEKIIWLEELP